MRNKLTVDGEVADKQFPLRTTGKIYDFFIVKAGENNTSVNVVINNVLSQYVNRYGKKQSKTKK